MCRNVKRITHTIDGREFTIYSACGKCYECQTDARGHFAFRCEGELSNSMQAYFCSITYDDAHLFSFKSDWFKASYLAEQNKLPYKQRHYDIFLLNKNDTRLMRRRLRYLIDKFFGFKDCPRFVECGEYGDLHNRPHAHILYFLPWFIRQDIFQHMLQLVWDYGEIQVGDVTYASINYVGKHCVKSSQGCKYQQIYSPSYLLQSTYPYGIGYNLRYDKYIRSLYDSGQKFIEYQGYKYTFPRFLTKYYHPDKLTEQEFELLEHTSKLNFVKKLQLSDIQSDYALSLDKENFERFYELYRSYLMSDDFKERMRYEKLRLQKKHTIKYNPIN